MLDKDLRFVNFMRGSFPRRKANLNNVRSSWVEFSQTFNIEF